MERHCGYASKTNSATKWSNGLSGSSSSKSEKQRRRGRGRQERRRRILRSAAEHLNGIAAVYARVVSFAIDCTFSAPRRAGETVHIFKHGTRRKDREWKNVKSSTALRGNNGDPF